MQVIKVNGKEIELEKATSVEVYLESAGYQMKRIAVELNGEILPKNEYADRMLEDGDCPTARRVVAPGRTRSSTTTCLTPGRAASSTGPAMW